MEVISINNFNFTQKQKECSKGLANKQNIKPLLIKEEGKCKRLILASSLIILKSLQ